MRRARHSAVTAQAGRKPPQPVVCVGRRESTTAPEEDAKPKKARLVAAQGLLLTILAK